MQPFIPVDRRHGPHSEWQKMCGLVTSQKLMPPHLKYTPRPLCSPLASQMMHHAKYFIGHSYIASIVSEGVPVSNVTFEPGCHKHGAAPDSWFSHLAITVPGENTSNKWLEPVRDKEYTKLHESEL